MERTNAVYYLVKITTSDKIEEHVEKIYNLENAIAVFKEVALFENEVKHLLAVTKEGEIILDTVRFGSRSHRKELMK